MNDLMDPINSPLKITADLQIKQLQVALDFSHRGELVEAKRLYEAIIQNDPDNFDALHMSAIILHKWKKWQDAEKFFQQALKSRPNFAPLHCHYGLSLHRLKRMEDAIQNFNIAISIHPDFPQAYNNRGNVFQDLGRLDESLADYDCAVAIKPDYAEVYLSRGAVLCDLRRFEEALESYEKYKSVRGDDSEWHTNKALVLLLNGKLAEGFALYVRRKVRSLPSPKLDSDRLWNGMTPIANRRILVHCEQGLGDTIQFCRYVLMLAKMGAYILFAPQKSLKMLFSNLHSDCKIVDDTDFSLEFDYHFPLLSLPSAFETVLATIPNKTPYLVADPDLISKWNQVLGETGFKIGICWQGSTGKVDAGRSLLLRQFEALSGIPDVRLISLHKGDGESQLTDLPEGMIVETLGDDFDAGPDAFVDTAAVMICCDLVITSDTAVAHLAGALGVKTWVALKSVPDWRWMLDRDDSPWYPTMRLFRQQSHGDWDGVFEEIRQALVRLLTSQKSSRLFVDPPQIAATEAGSASNHKKIFNMIYERNIWGNGSGSGSAPDNTNSYRNFLSNFIKTNDIKSVVDLGCGDWQFSKLIDWTGLNYIGIDVSDAVLNNTKLYSGDGISFFEMDALTGELPAADLLIMKDVIQHWSNVDILSFIPRLQRYKRALITNGFHPAGLPRTNADIATGGWRPVDMKSPPFNLKGDYIHWYNGGEPKWVFLWQCQS